MSQYLESIPSMPTENCDPACFARMLPRLNQFSKALLNKTAKPQLPNQPHKFQIPGTESKTKILKL